MAKSTKPRNDWEAIRLDYINGMSMKELATKYDIHHPDILRKARQQGWGEHKSLVKDYDNLAVEITEVVQVEIDKNPKLQALQDKLHSNLLPSQIEQANKDVAMLALYKANMLAAQQKILKAIDKSAVQASDILDANPSGLYTSKIGADGSVSYEPANNYLRNLAPFFAENNKALGLAAAQTAIQVNQTVNSKDDEDDSVVKFYIPKNDR